MTGALPEGKRRGRPRESRHSDGEDVVRLAEATGEDDRQLGILGGTAGRRPGMTSAPLFVFTPGCEALHTIGLFIRLQYAHTHVGDERDRGQGGEAEGGHQNGHGLTIQTSQLALGTRQGIIPHH